MRNLSFILFILAELCAELERDCLCIFIIIQQSVKKKGELQRMKHKDTRTHCAEEDVTLPVRSLLASAH